VEIAASSRALVRGGFKREDYDKLNASPGKPQDEMATPFRTAFTQVKGMFQPAFI
jgi:hypothetical protein